MLLESGHDPDYACDLHGGRTALGELCFRAVLAGREQESQACETMGMLIKCPTDLALRGKDNRTVLHLALVNDQPVEVTKTLLRFKEVYKDIRSHSETFLFEDSRGISMSPDRYIAEYCDCSDTLKRTLIDILQTTMCKEKWFKKKGQQLSDCKGLPPGMKEAMEQQDLADQAELRASHRRRMREKEERDLESARHQARLQQSKEQTDHNLNSTQRIHTQQLAHDNALLVQQREHRQLERSDELNHAHNKSEMEKRMIESREQAERRSHDRTMQRFERQDASISLAARKQGALIEAARAANVPASQGQLGWHPD
jgi:ankyrin repeat domain-containing protein 50